MAAYCGTGKVWLVVVAIGIMKIAMSEQNAGSTAQIPLLEVLQ